MKDSAFSEEVINRIGSLKSIMRDNKKQHILSFTQEKMI